MPLLLNIFEGLLQTKTMATSWKLHKKDNMASDVIIVMARPAVLPTTML